MMSIKYIYRFFKKVIKTLVPITTRGRFLKSKI